MSSNTSKKGIDAAETRVQQRIRKDAELITEYDVRRENDGELRFVWICTEE